MKWLRWWGLAVFSSLILLFIILWFFVAPWLIKNSIETAGSEALGAKLDVNEVSLGLFPASLEINGMALTDPDSPMRNMMEIGTTKIAIDSEFLFWKKLVIDDLDFSDLAFNTPREKSGALKGGRLTTKALATVSEFKLPDINSVNVNKLIQSADLVTTKRISNLNKMQKEMQSYWKTNLDKKKLSDSIATIKEEFNRLKSRAKKNKFNLLKDRKKWKKLKKSLNRERDKYRQLKRKFNQDKKSLKNQISLVKQGPKDDLDLLMKKAGIKGNLVEDISSKLIGPEMTPWLMKGLKLVQLQSGQKNKTETETQTDSDFSRKKGNKHYFKDKVKIPDFLIKRLHANGGDSSIKIQSEGANIAIPPWMWALPAKLSGEINGNGTADFEFDSIWKSEKEMHSKAQLNVNNWPISNLPLFQLGEQKWTLSQGLLMTHMNANITLSDINLNWELQISSPKLKKIDALSGWKSLLLDAINQQNAIAIKIKVEGELLNPQIKVSSSLESVFKNILKQRLLKEADKLKADLKKALTSKLGASKDFSSYTSQLDGFGNQLNFNDDKLKKMLSGIKL